MSHDELRALMEHAEEAGCIDLSAFTQLVTEFDLEDEEISSLYEQIDERGIELTDDRRLPAVEETHFSTGSSTRSRRSTRATAFSSST
jgi:hypothetical protein